MYAMYSCKNSPRQEQRKISIYDPRHKIVFERAFFVLSVLTYIHMGTIKIITKNNLFNILD